MTEQRVFRTLDGLRGVAALLIVMRHTEHFFAPIRFQESYLAVDLFFGMSGVVLCHSYERKLVRTLSPWRFAWLRIIRIYPLYLLACAIAVPALLLTPDSQVTTRNLLPIVLLALLLLPNVSGRDLYPLDAPSWSLFFELAVNFAYGFLVRGLTSKRLLAVVSISGMALVPVVSASQHHNMNLGFTLRSFPTGFFRVSYSFFLGVLINRAYRGRSLAVRGRTANLLSWIMLATVTVLLTLPVARRFQASYDLVTVIFLFPGIIAASLALEMSGRSARVFQVLGVVSYATYVLHAPLARLIESVLPLNGLEIVPLAPWIGFAFLACLVVGCHIVDQEYDIPVRRWLSRLRQRQS